MNTTISKEPLDLKEKIGKKAIEETMNGQKVRRN